MKCPNCGREVEVFEKRSWTDEEEKILLDLIWAGYSQAKAAIRLRRSTESVRKKLAALRKAEETKISG
jgi:hypothetical protein